MDKKLWKRLLWALPAFIHKLLTKKTGKVLVRHEATNEAHKDRLVGYTWIDWSTWEESKKRH